MPTSPEATNSSTAASEAPVLRYCCQPVQPARQFDPAVDAARTRAILAGGKKWVNGTQLRYCCYQGGDAVADAWKGGAAAIDGVRKAFESWFQLGIGISFRQVSRPDEATIRIAFDPAGGSWSYVGRDNLNIRDPLQRTMNFGWPLDTPYGRDTAMHEIGHALGLEHEHQNPFAGIAWDSDAVRRYFQGPPNNWDAQKIDWNILRKISPAEVKGSNWDPDSIMEYAFGAGLIVEPAAYRGGLQPRGGLSPADKAWIVASYPPGSPLAAIPALEVGRSLKLAIKAGETQVFDFTPPQTRSYSIATSGSADTLLVLFEVRADGNVRIAADDDSGSDRNARIEMSLRSGQRYQIGVRLYYEKMAAETALMVT